MIFEQASITLQLQRLQKCKTCEYWKPYFKIWFIKIYGFEQCQKCGCWLKAKVKLKNEKCKINLW